MNFKTNITRLKTVKIGLKDWQWLHQEWLSQQERKQFRFVKDQQMANKKDLKGEKNHNQQTEPDTTSRPFIRVYSK